MAISFCKSRSAGSLRALSRIAFLPGVASLATGFFLTQPAHSAAIYNFRTNPQFTASSRPFTEGGITLTVDNAKGTNITTAVSTLGQTGGVNTDINNGLCVALFAGYNVGKCQYVSSTPGDPTLTALTFTFNKSVYLKSFDVLKVGGVESGTLSFTSSTSSETFSFLNPGGADTANGVVFRSFAFAPNFVAEAGTSMTVSSVGTVFSSGQPGSFRISNFLVEEVPGPLPLLGFAGAIGWSRKLRQKCNR
jgi:hypothetical protein